MKKDGNIFVALMAGIGGILIGGIIYYMVNSMDIIAYISSIAGVLLSFIFFSEVRKFDRKTIFPVSSLFMVLNLLMVFLLDAMIFAMDEIALLNRFKGLSKVRRLSFNEVFMKYPSLLKKYGLYAKDYFNLLIIVLGTILIAYAIYNEIRHRELLELINSVKKSNKDE